MIEIAAGFFFAAAVAGWALAFRSRISALEAEHRLIESTRMLRAANGMAAHQHKIIVALEERISEHNGEGVFVYGKN